MFEVGDATGTRQTRWADAVAMNLYPSRGLEIHGFEVKASRSDWLSELRNPAKSAPVQQYCDRWWIVAPPGVVADGELPPTWGLLEAKVGKLRQVCAAPKLEAKPVTGAFVAAMLRRAGEADAAEVEALVQKRVTEIRENDEKHIQRQIEYRTAAAKRIEDRIAKIKEITGVDLDHWCHEEELGRAVKMVLDSGVMSAYGGIAALHRLAEKFAKDCAEAMAAMPMTKDKEAA